MVLNIIKLLNFCKNLNGRMFLVFDIVNLIKNILIFWLSFLKIVLRCTRLNIW